MCVAMGRRAMSTSPSRSKFIPTAEQARTRCSEAVRTVWLVLLAVGACSSPPAHAPDAAPLDTAAPDVGADGPSACSDGPSVSRAQLIDASISYLRAAFGVGDGFDGGEVGYGEMWVSLDDICSYADWSALGYVAPIAAERVPVELRATHDRVAVMWTLSGRKFIVYLESTHDVGTLGTWQAGRLPDSVISEASSSAPTASVMALADQIRSAHSALTVMWLDLIGTITIDAVIGEFGEPTAPLIPIAEIEAGAASLRSSGLFSSIEWSGLVFRIPNDQTAFVPVTEDVLRPECLRAATRDKRDAGQFTTSPSLATPLGSGVVEHVPACDMVD